MALSKRLLAIYQMVEKGSVVADIGCDHGLLSMALVQGKVCDHVVACDLRSGPLLRAKESIARAGLEKQITTLQRDGMNDLPEDVDTIVIAGMGFDTIKGILEQQGNELHKYRRIIIQCNKHVDDVRRWISEHHYHLICEDLVKEDHFYEILAFAPTTGRTLSDDEILFGHLENHPEFLPYWMHRSHKISAILTHMPKHDAHYLALYALLQTIKTKIEAK
ncbi:MAG: class I SAM-dependent methyltransferase [Longicatena sp.]